MALTRTVTVTRPVSGPIADLVYFVRRLEKMGVIKAVNMPLTDDQLVEMADDYWDSAHGED